MTRQVDTEKIVRTVRAAAGDTQARAATAAAPTVAMAETVDLDQHLTLSEWARELIHKALDNAPPLPAPDVIDDLQGRYGKNPKDPMNRLSIPPLVQELPEYLALQEYKAAIDDRRRRLEAAKGRWRARRAKVQERYEHDVEATMAAGGLPPDPPQLETWPYERRPAPPAHGSLAAQHGWSTGPSIDIAFQQFDRMMDVITAAEQGLVLEHRDRAMEVLESELGPLDARVVEAQRALDQATKAAASKRELLDELKYLGKPKRYLPYERSVDTGLIGAVTHGYV